MSSGSAAFQQAAEDVTKLAKKPTSAELCELYGLYKTVTVGTAPEQKPSLVSLTNRRKHAAWAAVTFTAEEADAEYIQLVNRLKEKYGMA